MTVDKANEVSLHTWRNMPKGLIYKIFTLLFLGAILSPGTTFADQNSAGQTAEEVVKNFLFRAAQSYGTNIEVNLISGTGQIQQCENADPFLPATRGEVLGRVQVGIRCNDGEYTRYVQAHVSAYGEYLVANEDLSSGVRVSGSMVRTETGDLSQLPRHAIFDAAELVGQQSRRTIREGTVLQKNMFVTPALISRGQTVTIQAGGEGFTITREGEAIDSGAMGDYIRVRVGQREVVTGRIISDSRVKVD